MGPSQCEWNGKSQSSGQLLPPWVTWPEKGKNNELAPKVWLGEQAAERGDKPKTSMWESSVIFKKKKIISIISIILRDCFSMCTLAS